MKPTIHVRARSSWRKAGRLSLVRKAAGAALVQGALMEPGGAWEWTIRLSDDVDLQQLNRQFRGMDKPTDVLSFSGERYKDGICIMPGGATIADEAGEYLGDIVISMERCAAQAAAAGHDIDDELALLVVHGTLHLLGYDHDTRTRKARMWSAQARALASLGIDISVP
jgi:probable rRNA maturation factor